jgi:hypothetical protein
MIECHAAMGAKQQLEPFRYDAGALSPEAVPMGEVNGVIQKVRNNEVRYRMVLKN